MHVADDPRLRAAVAAHPYPLLFVTISGAHLYGFASADSDFDLRGVHLLPLANLLGLDLRDETVSREEVRDGAEVDLVTHDARKFFGLLLKKNGYVLEQLLSPLVVHAAPGFEELRELARGCVTKNHAHHYKGFALNQWELFQREQPRRVKPLLYCYRVLLTGIHLLRTGETEANLVTLNEGEFHLAHVADLLAAKRAGSEGETLADDAGAFAFHEREFARLLAGLERAAEASPLPELPRAREELNALLLRLRLGCGEGRRAAAPPAHKVPGAGGGGWRPWKLTPARKRPFRVAATAARVVPGKGAPRPANPVCGVGLQEIGLPHPSAGVLHLDRW